MGFRAFGKPHEDFVRRRVDHIQIAPWDVLQPADQKRSDKLLLAHLVRHQFQKEPPNDHWLRDDRPIRETKRWILNNACDGVRAFAGSRDPHFQQPVAGG